MNQARVLPNLQMSPKKDLHLSNPTRSSPQQHLSQQQQQQNKRSQQYLYQDSTSHQSFNNSSNLLVRLPQPTINNDCISSNRSSPGGARIASLSAIKSIDMRAEPSPRKITLTNGNGTISSNSTHTDSSTTTTAKTTPPTQLVSPTRTTSPPSPIKLDPQDLVMSKEDTVNKNNLSTAIETSKFSSSIEQVAAALSLVARKNLPLPAMSSQAPIGIKKKFRPKKMQVPPPTYIPFTWDKYLEILPASVAPRQAFRHAFPPPKNEFLPNMKLEAKDENSGNWSLASVIALDGLRLRLRFEGNDAMNDFFEIIDSDRIRPVGFGDPLLPPMRFKKNFSTYNKFVEKVLSRQDTIIAQPNIFPPTPRRPPKNLFRVNMKLEAVDRKNPDLICPATIGEIRGDDIEIIFDGWKGSFDYFCRYDSREIFPVNWCRDTNSHIIAPNNWEKLLKNQSHAADSPGPIKDQITSDFETSLSKPKSITGKNKNSDREKDMLKSSKKKRKISKESKVQSQSKPLRKVKLSRKDLPRFSTDQRLDESIKSEGVRTRDDHEYESSSASIHVQGLSFMSNGNQPDDEQKPDQYNETQDISREEVLDRYQCQRVVPYQVWREEKDKSNSTDGQVSEVYDSPPTKAETTNASGGYKSWSVSDVTRMLMSDATLEKYIRVFVEHEIDGPAFVLLNTDTMVNHMGLKIGPVLKINNLIEQAKKLT